LGSLAKSMLEQTTTDTSNNVKILLVDDREDNLFSIETVLEQDGYHFTKANSGRQALKILLKEQDFSLILMDVKMPDINGFETAAMIYEREKLRHIPIIFITAYHYSEDIIFKGYKTGGVDYIYKPINPELIRAKVAVFVDLYRKNRQLRMQEQRLVAINSELEERVRERTDELLNKNLELEAKNLELEKINNDLDNFVYTASHDLKSPISNLEGLMNMLEKSLKTKIGDREVKILEMINNSISKFNKTIHDLTNIIKVQKDIDAEAEPVNIREFIDDVKTDISNLIQESGAVIHEKLEVQQLIYAKKNLRSIIYNLLSNAIKYRSPDRPAEVHIKTRMDNGSFLLTVKDNGLGLSPEQQSKLFTMFKRLHTHVEGTGLGLYIIKRIVENNKGRIEVESEEGKGTTFRIWFN
jgi:two-component system sensor histidine kinase/response regulator